MAALTALNHLVPAPEPRLLVAAVAAAVGRSDDLSRATAGDMDWSGLPDLAATHRIASLLQHELRRAECLERLPASAQAELAAAAQTETAGALVSRQLLLSVSRALSEAGIRHTLLKGAALTELVYPPELPRTMSDLDLLLGASDLERAGAALEALGYRRLVLEVDPGYHRVFGQGSRLVELHWRLSHMTPFDLSLPVPEGTAGGRSSSLGGLASLPAPLALFFQVAFHHVFLNRFYGGLQGLLDLALLWQRYGSEFPDSAMLGFARRGRLEGVMYWTLAVLEEWVGLPVSAPLRTALRPPGYAARAGRRLLEENFAAGLTHRGPRPDLPNGWSRYRWHLACSSARSPAVIARTFIFYASKMPGAGRTGPVPARGRL